jgi:hypothetical protein
MAFAEDISVIEAYAATREQGLAVDPRYAPTSRLAARGRVSRFEIGGSSQERQIRRLAEAVWKEGTHESNKQLLRRP